MGRAAALQGDQREALKLFTRTQQQYRRHARRPRRQARRSRHPPPRGRRPHGALLWYRQVLQSDIDPDTYRSDVLPIEQLRSRILEAVGDFVRKGLFANAITHARPLSAAVHAHPGAGAPRQDAPRMGRSGTAPGRRRKQDAARNCVARVCAGSAKPASRSSDLAALRFATANYPTDLWNSADCFYRGHSYSNAARLLDVYLQNEPEKRNAQALLRLGQVSLALGRVDQCIAALEECIELYDRDNATYQARIDCAKAYLVSRRHRPRPSNCCASTSPAARSKPQSPEWKDSLFALGHAAVRTGPLRGSDRHAGRSRRTLSRRSPDAAGPLRDRRSLSPLGGRTARTAAKTPAPPANAKRIEQLVNERLTLALQQFKEGAEHASRSSPQRPGRPAYGHDAPQLLHARRRVLFDLGRYQEAIEAYQNVSSLYPNEPFVLETFVQIANCWQRLDRAENAHGAIEQAQLTLEQLPSDADFAATTAFSREEWRMLLDNMSQW